MGREDAHGIWKKKNYHGTQEGVLLGVPLYARGGEKGRDEGERGARGGREGDRRSEEK